MNVYNNGLVMAHQLPIKFKLQSAKNGKNMAYNCLNFIEDIYEGFTFRKKCSTIRKCSIKAPSKGTFLGLDGNLPSNK